MGALLDQAIEEQVELIAYPEIPHDVFPQEDPPDFDQFFENEVPPKALEPLLRRATEARVAVHAGFREKADGQYFNTALLNYRDGRLCGTFRKIHLPGTKAAHGFAQVYEPYSLRPRRHGLSRSQCRGRQDRHRDLPGPALSGELSRAGAPGRRDHPDRLQHAHLRAGARPERAVPAPPGLREPLLRGRHRQGGGGGRCGADRRQRDHQSARPGARQGCDDRRRARGDADRPRPGESRAKAVELPRPAPAPALQPVASVTEKETHR